jgi:ABC-type Fe3+/spermidine/putrescine transport system ATPase subunit
VLREVSLSVPDGSFVTLLGPSGCGKTTVLRIVGGFVEPDAGAVTLGGTSLLGLPPERRDVGMVFQSYALFPHLDVFHNVSFGLRMRRAGRAEQRRRVAEMLDLVRLTGLDRRRPGQLSGGQQQRVALARALVTRPRLLLLDEPLSALDKQFRAEMQIELKTLQRTVGITTLFVTHDQEEAMALSDTIAVMRDGQIEQAGPPLVVYGRPATPFVADFVGLSNILEGTAEAGPSPELGLLRTPRGAVLAFRPSGPCAAGARLRAMVRPEQIGVVAGDDSAGAGLNRYRGRVVNTVFLGAVTHIFVETELGLLRALAVTSPAGLPAVDQEVTLAIDPAGVTVYAL